MSTPPTPQTMVSQNGMLSRLPGAKNLPSRPMMMPAMITPMMSTGDPFQRLGTASALRASPSGRGAIQHGNHRTTGQAPLAAPRYRSPRAWLARFDAGVGQHPAQVDEQLSVDVFAGWRLQDLGLAAELHPGPAVGPLGGRAHGLHPRTHP